MDGIYAAGIHGNISIVNSGDINAGEHGIHAGSCNSGPDCTYGEIWIANSGAIAAGQIGIIATNFAYTPCGCSPNFGDGANITIVNSGPVAAPFAGILATAGGNNATVTVINQGKITSDLVGIFAATGIDTYFDCGCYGSTLPYFEPSGFGDNSPVFVSNSGEIDPAVGILAFTGGNNSPIDIQNSGKIAATFAGIAAASYGANSGIHIVNSGEITTTGGAGYGAIPIVPNVGYSVAIAASTVGEGSNIVVENSGEVNGKGKFGIGIAAYTPGPGSSTLIKNSGSIAGGYAGILAASATGTTIVNSGKITADFVLRHRRLRAARPRSTTAGTSRALWSSTPTILFVNQKGGVFETKLTSDFEPRTAERSVPQRARRHGAGRDRPEDEGA